MMNKKNCKVVFCVALGLTLSACTDYVQEIEDAHNEFNGIANGKSNGGNGGTSPGYYSDPYIENGVETRTLQALAFDVVLRDFSVEHPDFENFSEEYVSTGDGNYCTKGGSTSCGDMILEKGYIHYDAYWHADLAPYHYTCGNFRSKTGATIGSDGFPMTQNPYLPPYLQVASATGKALEYGQCADGYDRNFVNANLTEYVGKAGCAKGDWSIPVYYTPGMVQKNLVFAPTPDGRLDMYDGVFIQKANDLCDNSNFHQWYSDVPNVNFRINKTLSLPVSDKPGYFLVDYDYGNGGFFPLDSISNGNYVTTAACDYSVQSDNSSCLQWGPQSLSVYCPPYDYQYASTQTDKDGLSTATICSAWLLNGGPKHPAAATWAVQGDGPLGTKYLRNYGYTMMGYIKFKYRSANQFPTPEVFSFVGDDDMWIYVDGVLAVDLGGTHNATPGVVNIQTLALNNHGCHAGEPLASYTNCDAANDALGWADNTWHHLHFFYANRQSSGADLFLRTNLAEIAPPRYSQK